MEGDIERIPVTDITTRKLEELLAGLMIDDNGELIDPTVTIPQEKQSEIGASEVDIKAWNSLRMTVCAVRNPVSPHMAYEGKIYVMQHGSRNRFTMAAVEVEYSPDEWLAVAAFETVKEDQIDTMRELEIIEGTRGVDEVIEEFSVAQRAIIREKASVIAGDELLRLVESEQEALEAAQAIAEAEARIEAFVDKSLADISDRYPDLAPMYHALLRAYLPMVDAWEKVWSRVALARMDAVHVAMLRDAPSISEAEGQRLSKVLASVANL